MTSLPKPLRLLVLSAAVVLCALSATFTAAAIGPGPAAPSVAPGKPTVEQFILLESDSALALE